MRRTSRKGLSGWASGLTLIGLLITVAIVIYVFKEMADVSLTAGRTGGSEINRIQKTLDLGRGVKEEVEERGESLDHEQAAGSTQPTQADGAEDGAAAPNEDDAEAGGEGDARPADASQEDAGGGASGPEAGTPLGPISPVTPVAPVQESGGADYSKARSPASQATGAAERRNRELEELLE